MARTWVPINLAKSFSRPVTSDSPSRIAFSKFLRGSLYLRDSDVSGNTFYGVRDALRQLAVAAFECGRNLRGGIALLRGKLTQQVAVQPPIACNTLQSIGLIHSCDFRQSHFFSGFGGCRHRLASTACFGRGFAHRSNVANRLSGSIGFDT